MLREVSGGHGAVQSKGGRRGDRATQELGSGGFGVTARAWLEPEWRGSREGKCDLPQVFRGPLAPRGAQPGSGRKLFQEPRWLTTGGPWGWGKDDIPRAFWQVDPADSHTPGPHYSPQAQVHGFALTWQALPCPPQGSKGSVVTLWSKAPGGLEGEGFSPMGDLLLFLSLCLPLPPSWALLKIKVLGVCMCASECVHTRVCVWWQDGQEGASKDLSCLRAAVGGV